MNSSAFPDLGAELRASLVDVALSVDMLRDLRDRGCIDPDEAARLVSSVLDVLERIQFACEARAGEVQQVITMLSRDFGQVTRFPN